jgi:hypothetical protein
MITLLASLAGFISSLIPEIVRYFTDKNDKKHELQILEYQIKLKKQKIDNQLDEIDIASSNTHMQTIYKTYKTGISWVDALNGSVRPVLAYSFFFIYTFVKYLQYQLIISSINVNDIFTILWSLEDQAIFSGIISFYFGQRAVSKLRNKS